MSNVFYSHTVRPLLLIAIFLLFCVPEFASAASLRVNPNTGVFSVGNTFTVSVLLHTENASVNAADARLTFNPKELQVLSAHRNGSIFNLWTEEPTFSNTLGTISFGGGSPSGYVGAQGNVMTLTLKTIAAGTPKIQFASGSVLAADGLGTNVLKGMNGATFTVTSEATTPEPEYIAPAHTPKAPVITSSTHPDQNEWYQSKNAFLEWEIPTDVISVRMLFDDSPQTIPTNVYDERITSREIEDVGEGTNYFHIQFKNSEGWGKIAHYALHTDTTPPKDFRIEEHTGADSPGVTFKFIFDDVSPVDTYRIQIDGAEPLVHSDESLSKTFTRAGLKPGYHTLVVEAIDSAGNISVASYAFTIHAFEKPIFIEYPSRIPTDVIPALVGTTRPNADVHIEVKRLSDNTVLTSLDDGGKLVYRSDEHGKFVYVPTHAFEDVGVYEITARATDQNGAMSEPSDPVRIIVEVPGFISVGTRLISFLSVLVPLIALLLLATIGAWYAWFRFIRWRRVIRKETLEVEERLTLSFNGIVKNLEKNIDELVKSKKGKLTKAEQTLISEMKQDLQSARKEIMKEVEDIEDIVR